MRFEIVLAPEAARSLRSLPAYHRAAIRNGLETHLRHSRMKISKSRIKRLRGLSQPRYRLRINEFRIFYDIVDQEVQVLTIVSKKDAEAWLESFGSPET